jgi:hypothetical protein
MKETLICIHVMPHELVMFERWMNDFRRNVSLLSSSDRLTLRASLNLNPRLINWSRSPLSPAYFTRRFLELIDGLPTLHEIRDDESLAGTTQQKRESIALNYDQFIFADPDIAYPSYLLKGMLGVADKLSGRYMISPPVVRLWDADWDPLVHPDFLSKPLGYHVTHSADETRSQTPKEVYAVPVEETKFGTGWLNMYSQELMKFVGIPESLGGYGAEDTYIGLSSRISREHGFPVPVYLLRNVYISEDYASRDSTLKDLLMHKDLRSEQRVEAEKQIARELSAFAKRALGKDLGFSFG